MGVWIEPKTDWSANDCLNATDYNRIVCNMAYLKAFLDTLFNGLTDITTMEEKTYTSLIFAREINAIETALQTLNLETYRFDIGNPMEYIANGKTIDYNELNRIESAMSKLNVQMVNHKENLTRLAFILGNQKGIMV